MTRVDFRVEKNELRGVYYSETDRCLVYLPMHEDIEDIYKTISHELFHACFDKAGETDEMDEDMEERLIYNVQWAEESLA
jgi:hypothetical protein|tara:strand:- start:2817 stop:3056 length:240 start_codon:yes stop_codon:yes gene_type:complete